MGYHLSILKRKGPVSQKFGRLQSRKVERAYKVYFKKRLPVKTIGRQVGLKNFYAIIKEHRALGWDVPKPLFTYDSNDRKRTIARMNRNKNRMTKGLKILTVFFGILLMGSLATGQPTHQSSEFKAGSELAVGCN